MDIIEVVMRLIEREDVYHDRKTRMAWTAGALYFTFSSLLIYCLVKLRSSGFRFDDSREKCILIIMLVSLWFCAVIFISLQLQSRWQSVDRTNMYNKTIWSGKADKIKTGFSLWDYFDEEGKTYHLNKKGMPALVRKPLLIACLSVVSPIWALLFFFYDVYHSYKKEPNLSTENEEKRKAREEKEWKPKFSDLCLSQRWDDRYKRQLLEETRYRSEVPVYTIMIVFLAVQIYLVCKLGVDP